MFYRLLGKLFFLFYICPAIRRVGSVIVDKSIKELDVWVKGQDKKLEEKQAQARRVHPAGSRRR
jgi:hypothetical protein